MAEDVKIRFNFSKFYLIWNRSNGRVTTYWPNDTRSDSWLHWSDDYHGRLLGLSGGEHRLQHELAHHLVGLCSPEGYEIGGCPIVWRDAYGEEQPQPWSQDREWLITALQYYSRGLEHAEGALRPMRDWGVDVDVFARQLNHLLVWAIHSEHGETIDALAGLFVPDSGFISWEDDE